MNRRTPPRPANFRDFGAQRSRWGGRVAPGRLHRGGQLHRLSGAEFAAFAGSNFQVIADLRHAGERTRDRVTWKHAGSPLLLEGEPEGDAPHMELLRQTDLTVAAIDRFYIDVYRWLPFERGYRQLFTRAVAALQNLDGRALFYCSAGKDRTGMLAALTLELLGVHRDDVLGDYLRSGADPDLGRLAEETRLSMERRLGRAVSPAIAGHWLGVQPAYLDAMFDEIQERSGSVEAYFAAGGVDAHTLERIRQRLLIDC